VKYGGFVWVTLNDKIEHSVEEWAQGSFDCMQKALDAEPLGFFIIIRPLYHAITNSGMIQILSFIMIIFITTIG
jgi:hypothetical protein